MLELLAARRTTKMIGDPENPLVSDGVDSQILENMLSAAGNAPFHYACDREHQVNLPSPVPWRVYSLSAVGCRALMKRLIETGDTTKIPNMLAVSAHLFQVTWLPDPGTVKQGVYAKEGGVFDGTLRNMEHIAAASSFAQSLLLAGGAHGFKTYWSSGGPLRGKQICDWFGIPGNQILLGAIFLFPQSSGNIEIKPGALAEKRGCVDDWSRSAEIE